MRRIGHPPDWDPVMNYSAVLHYLKATQAVGSRDADKIIAKMREMPVNDVATKNGHLRPDGRLERDLYLLEVKTPAESTGPWDLYKVDATIPAAKALRPLDQGGARWSAIADGQPVILLMHPPISRGTAGPRSHTHRRRELPSANPTLYGQRPFARRAISFGFDMARPKIVEDIGSSIGPIERETLNDRVYRELKNSIMAGAFKPGAELTLRSVAEALGTSFMPVRDAMRRLATERGLEIRPSRTIAIPTLSAEEFLELRRVRVLLEGEAVALARGKNHGTATRQRADVLKSSKA